MSAICEPDYSKCTRKCCFAGPGGQGSVISDCDNPCACYGPEGAIDPETGECKGGEGYAPCIAVIDETTPGVATQTQDWIAFRAAWPLRPFYLLVPGNTGDVFLPNGWDGSVYAVSRDNGNAGSASNWFNIIGLGYIPTSQPVFLFIDNSGSMTTSTVEASYNLFMQECNSRGIPVYAVSNGDERYIQPFIAALVPST